jgi:hypothetical protein
VISPLFTWSISSLSPRPDFSGVIILCPESCSALLFPEYGRALLFPESGSALFIPWSGNAFFLLSFFIIFISVVCLAHVPVLAILCVVLNVLQRGHTLILLPVWCRRAVGGGRDEAGNADQLMVCLCSVHICQIISLPPPPRTSG